MPAERRPRSVFRRDTPSIEPTVYAAHVHWICSGNMKKRGHAVTGISFSFRFINFVNLWPILTLCVADMVHAVADVVCGRYRLWPIWLWPIWFVADIIVSRFALFFICFLADVIPVCNTVLHSRFWLYTGR